MDVFLHDVPFVLKRRADAAIVNYVLNEMKSVDTDLVVVMKLEIVDITVSVLTQHMLVQFLSLLFRFLDIL